LFKLGHYNPLWLDQQEASGSSIASADKIR
jgi:hypothetical protein